MKLRAHHSRRVGALATTLLIISASAALAETTLQTGDVAVVGTASAAPGATLVRGGQSTFDLTVTANDGALNGNQCDGVKNKVTVPTNFTVSTNTEGVAVLTASGSESKTFLCGSYSSTSSQTLTFTGRVLTASATAPLGRTSYTITFGASSSMVILAEKVVLDAAFVAPKVHLEVRPRAVSGVTAAPASTNGHSTIDVAWTRSDDHAGLTKYVVTRKNMATGAMTTLQVDPGAGTAITQAFTDSGLTAETQYCYTVTARHTANAVNYDSTVAPVATATPVCATTTATPVTYTPTWLAPIDGGGTINIVKQGRVIPVKVKIALGDDTVSTGVVTFHHRTTSCSKTGETDVVTETAGSSNTGNEFKYVAEGSESFWQFNLNTRSLAAGCYTFDIKHDGAHVGAFVLSVSK